MAKNSFVVYHDYREKLQDLTDAQIGKLFRAMLDYSIEEKEPELTGVLAMAFRFIKFTMDDDKVKYKTICEKRKESGAIGGKQKVANASKFKQKVANVADTDTDTDTETDTETVSSLSIITHVRACETREELEELFKKRYKKYFNYWGYTEKDKKTFEGVIKTIVHAINLADADQLKFNHVKYDLLKFCKVIDNLDEEDIHKIVWQLMHSTEEIKNQTLYVIGSLINRGIEKGGGG